MATVKDLLPGEYLVAGAGVGPFDGPIHVVSRPGMTPERAAIECADEIYKSIWSGDTYAFDVTDHTGAAVRVELVGKVVTVWKVANG